MRWDRLRNEIAWGVVAAAVIYGVHYFFELPINAAVLLYVVVMAAYIYLDSRFARLERSIKAPAGDQELDEKLTRMHDSIVNRFSESIEPTAERVADLAWRYKKDHPRLDNEEDVVGI